MACMFCLKKNDDFFENLEQGKGIHLIAYLNASSDLKQEFQGETDIGDILENPLKSIAIPSCQTLGGKLLNNAANKLQTKTLKTIQNAKAITLTFDGWKNVAKQNILSITCITEEDEVIIYNARDISIEHSTKEATIKLVKGLLIKDGLKDVNINVIVTDFSSGYVATCRKLRKELLTIIWLLCFAYQANLCIADIFKLSQSFFSAIKQAVVVTTFFNKSPFFTILLKNIYNNFKISYFALTNPCETWCATTNTKKISEVEFDKYLDSIKEKYAMLTSQVPQKRQNTRQNVNLHNSNNKCSNNKNISFNFVDIISQVQKGTPSVKMAYTDEEDIAFISDNDLTELVQV
ncbi:34855_t:CDS:2 [Gigaspora margarita]|uniref:34855_t:CDS:1 n=1 Tax=Gigaspora margarita TaxID=4874 RepID=A0ABN7UF91_GIGMA|nr:34855_t:CDS:2 [Gigaspora margarita]